MTEVLELDVLPRRRVVRRGVAANATLALAGDAVTKLAALGAMVFAARLLPVHEFAALGVALAVSTVLTAVLDAGVATLVVRDGAAGRAEAGMLLRSSLFARLPLLALACAGAAIAGSALHERALALLVLGGAAAGAASLSLFGAFRAAQDLAFEAALKGVTALVGPAAVFVLAHARPTAASVLLGLTIGAVAVLPPLALALPRVIARGRRRPAWETARAAVPFGAMALATLAYYRLGTIMLGAWRPPREVAQFTIASTLAFGLLVLPNAVTTGLLPRLSAEADPEARRAPARAALEWTVRICVVTAAAVVVAAP